MDWIKKHLKALGKTQSDIADAVGKDRTVVTRMLSGQQPIAMNQVTPIAEVLNMSEAEFLANMGMDVLPDSTTGGTLPVLGMASCGLQGWGQAEAQNTQMERPPGLPDPEAFAVIANGDSMIPEGIRPGYICICSPNTGVSDGDAVFIERHDESFSLKRYAGIKNTWIVLQGYLAPDETGSQQIYTEEVDSTAIRRIAPVIYVRRKG